VVTSVTDRQTDGQKCDNNGDIIRRAIKMITVTYSKFIRYANFKKLLKLIKFAFLITESSSTA